MWTIVQAVPLSLPCPNPSRAIRAFEAVVGSRSGPPGLRLAGPIAWERPHGPRLRLAIEMPFAVLKVQHQASGCTNPVNSGCGSIRGSMERGTTPMCKRLASCFRRCLSWSCCASFTRHLRRGENRPSPGDCHPADFFLAHLA
jgi:hypothetical protein